MKTLSKVPKKTLIAMFAALSFAVAAAGMGVEDSLLRPSEIKMLQRIVAVDPSFRHGDRVKRYFRIHPTTKNRIPLRVEMVVPQSGDLYFGEYISYVMTINEPSGTITYEYDAGTAKRGRGTILVTPKDVVKTEFSCGATSCVTHIERNGRAVSGRGG